jgi:chaperone modulatory protein CbpM
MIRLEEFLIRARLEHGALEAWIAAGWIVPPRTEPEPAFSDADLARAQLIRDLREDLGVNDEGVSVILHLIDQMHGLRRGMQSLIEELRAAPGDA